MKDSDMIVGRHITDDHGRSPTTMGTQSGSYRHSLLCPVWGLPIVMLGSACRMGTMEVRHWAVLQF